MVDPIVHDAGDAYVVAAELSASPPLRDINRIALTIDKESLYILSREITFENSADLANAWPIHWTGKETVTFWDFNSESIDIQPVDDVLQRPS